MIQGNILSRFDLETLTLDDAEAVRHRAESCRDFDGQPVAAGVDGWGRWVGVRSWPRGEATCAWSWVNDIGTYVSGRRMG